MPQKVTVDITGMEDPEDGEAREQVVVVSECLKGVERAKTI
jgi:hypothetical protein